MEHNCTWTNVRILTAMHMLVDGVCACCLFLIIPEVNAHTAFKLILLYNVLAFATQPITGFLVDKYRLRTYALVLSSTLLILGALLESVMMRSRITHIYTAIVLLLGIGNSLFHVYGGKNVATTSHNDIRTIGVFVSSGALGITLGQTFCSQIVLLTAVLALGTLCFLNIQYDKALLHQEERNHITLHSTDRVPQEYYSVYMLFSILLIVAGRSFLSQIVTFVEEVDVKGWVLISIIAMTAKASGGYIAHRFGLQKTLIFTLILGSMCLLLSKYNIIFALLTLFLINLSMPITLHTAYKTIPGREGFIFGMLAAALLPGYYLAYLGSQYAITNTLLATLLPTIAIESLLLIYIRENNWKILSASVLMNICTNIPLNIFVQHYHLSLTGILVAEVLVIFIEALAFYIVIKNKRKAITYSILCNTTSYLTGILFMMLLKLCNIL